jgi:hypothetical protein
MLSLLALAVVSNPAMAQTEVDGAGYFQHDFRYRLNELPAGAWYYDLSAQPGIVRNRTTAHGHLRARSGRFSGVADADLVMTGFPTGVDGVEELSLRERVDPFRIEVHELYVQAQGFILPNLDLRVGQQMVQWGVGDQFNPTNTVNSDDLEDPLLFGDQLGNAMIRLDYAVGPMWQATAIMVPVFKPALLPASGPIGIGATARLPFHSSKLRYRVHSEQAAGLSFGYPTIGTETINDLPEATLANAQWAFRFGGAVGLQYVAFSYYRCRQDFPVPIRNHPTQETFAEPVCNPSNEEECIEGLLHTSTTLGFPKTQVFGFNATGELPPAFPIGYRVELGVEIPEEARIALTQDELAFSIITQPAGEYEYEIDGGRPLVLSADPYAKWVVGLDYTFGPMFYLNAQWVHGLLDEAGRGDFLSKGFAVRDGGVDPDSSFALCALDRNGEQCAVETLRRRINDYAVIGLDINFASSAGLFRLFTITDLSGVWKDEWNGSARERTFYSAFTPEGRAGVLYPELQYNFGGGFDSAVGALIQYGKSYSKFGAPEAGGSLVFTRVRYSF